MTLTAFRSPFALLAGLLAGASALSQQMDEVPFVTSPDNVTLEMLDMARVGPGDHVLDLGSGDGRIVIVAAKRFGATGLGVEIVPDLVQQSQRNAAAAGVADRVSFRVQDLFQTDLSPATVITMYLLPDVNLQLRPALLALKPGTRVVSHDYDMGDWKPDRTVVVPAPDKTVGREKVSSIHFWTVPAQVQGLWCGTELLRGASLQLSQRYQQFSGVLQFREDSRELAGQIAGAKLSTPRGQAGELALQVEGGQMRLLHATAPLASAIGSSFSRAVGERCT
jgi:SAM-dependent methyltransferase